MTADCGKLLGGEIQSCHRSSLDQPALQRITYISQSAPLLAMAKVKATQAICPGSDNGEMAGAAFCPLPASQHCDATGVSTAAGMEVASEG